MFRQYLLGLVLCLSLSIFSTQFAAGNMPTPNKVVVLILENHSYSQVVGSSAAPYINGLINDSMTALFTQSYGLTHPSQPNYIQLFSGSAQGSTTNNIPAGVPFSTPNLQSELVAAGKTFMAYSQGLPSTGYTGEASGAYARKHAPWVNWQGSLVNGFPPSSHVAFSAFPTNFNNLATVSFVVPDQNNDMHSGTDPQRITQCDTWVQNNLNNYIQWARNNNSLFILTFDEDDDLSGNRITTFFFGPMVYKGSYSTHIDHYNVLRTIEDLYGLTHAANAATAAPIDFCWKCTAQSSISANGATSYCAPNAITLTATSGMTYLWSTAATTQNISVDTSGSFYCKVRQSTGCWSTTNTITTTVKQPLAISGVSPLGANIGDLITINGTYLTSATSVNLNGQPLQYSIVNDSKITFTVPSGATSGYVQVLSFCGTAQSNFAMYIGSHIQLSLKFLIEGYVKSNGAMRSLLTGNKCDTVTLQLTNVVNPYSVFGSLQTTIDTSGNVVCTLPVWLYGNQYYFVLSGRNFLKTWSAQPVTLSENSSYDFTTVASRAYGSNQKSLNGVYAFYSGDVNQDEVINQFDMNLILTRILLNTSGISSADLNADKIVESIDFSMVENNIPISVAKP
jgi:hypothetical protein